MCILFVTCVKSQNLEKVNQDGKGSRNYASYGTVEALAYVWTAEEKIERRHVSHLQICEYGKCHVEDFFFLWQNLQERFQLNNRKNFLTIEWTPLEDDTLSSIGNV